MWSMLWNLMAVIGIMCCIGVVVIILMLSIDEIRVRHKRKHQMTYTKYFTEEDAENER